MNLPFTYLFSLFLFNCIIILSFMCIIILYLVFCLELIGGMLLSFLATGSSILDHYLRRINESYAIGFTSVLIIVSLVPFCFACDGCACEVWMYNCINVLTAS